MTNGQTLAVDLQFVSLATSTDTVTVTTDVKYIDVITPHPAVKVFASEDLLDANRTQPFGPSGPSAGTALTWR